MELHNSVHAAWIGLGNFSQLRARASSQQASAAVAGQAIQ